MKSSKDNCVKQKLQSWRWTYYGIPEWIEYPIVNPYKLPTRNLKQGCEGEDVKWLQWNLYKAGYNIPITGLFDSETDKALRLYQKKHKLEVDGIAGPITIKDMK
jgi:N-acetyl-anhydromuramyl-L-alanine amidase AmpD